MSSETGLIQLFSQHFPIIYEYRQMFFFGHGKKHPQMANEAEIYHLLSLSQASLSSILYIKKPVV